MSRTPGTLVDSTEDSGSPSLAPVGSAPYVVGSVTAPDPQMVASGLLPLQFEFNAVSATLTSDWVLTLTFSEPALAVFRKSICIVNGTSRCFINVNSHLIANGLSQMRAQLIASDGTVGWQAMVGLHINNHGLLAEKVRASMLSYGTPVVVDGACDRSHYDFSDESLKPWFDRSDASNHINEAYQNGRISAQEAAALAAFVADGYLIVEDITETSLLDLIGQELEDAVARKIQDYEYGSSLAMHDLHLVYPGIRRLWGHAHIMHWLELIFESNPRPGQTLTFIFGSQQGAHQDTVHLTPFPAGYMCGIWVAIDDVQPGSGELELYRGSHRRSHISMHQAEPATEKNCDCGPSTEALAAGWRQVIQSGKFERVVYRPRRGSVLIWHESLVHAGGLRLSLSRPRRSIVSHVFANGAVAFYVATGMPSTTTALPVPPLFDEIYPRAIG